MATMNGSTDHADESSTSSAHLGKRKRSTPPMLNGLSDADGQSKLSVQQKLQSLLQVVRRADPTPSLLRYPLPLKSSQERSPKRTRLSHAGQENDTIEFRIQSGTYTSFEALLEDVTRAQDGILAELDGVQTNGKTRSGSNAAAVKEQITQLTEIISSHRIGTKQTVKIEPEAAIAPADIVPDPPTGQVISLRTQTDKGPLQLFSGLPIPQSDDEAGLVQIDGRKLPNGFELVDPATMHPSVFARSKDKRLFGDVFRPHRNLKQLEVPRSSRNSFRGNKLEFISEPSLERPSSTNKAVYKFQNLVTGSWLDYSEGSAMSSQEFKRRQRERTLSGGDFKAAIAHDMLENEADKTKSLFNRAFSSFAPSSDNSVAVISEQDRSRQWWHKHGQRNMRAIFNHQYDLDGVDGIAGASEATMEDDFEDVVTNFEPMEADGIPDAHGEPSNIDDVLAEISDLLETLHSYQQIRTLDLRASVTASKPSSAEFDTYEILRSQLAILIGSLPPFAVAKLDGDKLKDLNVSTNIMLESVDYSGTAQADDFTLRRYRATQVGTPVPARAAQPVQARGPYQTPASVTRYGVNPAAYGQNSGIPATAAYGQRATASYQTPRAPITGQRPFPQTSYQQSGNSYGSQPTVQQFQRPQAGFGAYNSTATPQTSYLQRPSQPNYQTKAQEQALAYGGSMSPSRPTVNGQSPSGYAHGQYQQRTPQSSVTPAQQHASTEQRAMMERAKAYRQGSGTPGADGMGSHHGTPAAETQAQPQAVG